MLARRHGHAVPHLVPVPEDVSEEGATQDVTHTKTTPAKCAVQSSGEGSAGTAVELENVDTFLLQWDYLVSMDDSVVVKDTSNLNRMPTCAQTLQ